MSQQNFNWPRYWYWRDGESPWMDNGLLSSLYSWLDTTTQQKSLFELNDLLDIPCLILLGEPGMGKSHILLETYRSQRNTEKDRVCFFDLAEFSSTNELVQSIFIENKDFVAWKTSDFNLHLFLDSLDEAFIQIRKITERLNLFLEDLFEEIAKSYTPESPSDNDEVIVEEVRKITEPYKVDPPSGNEADVTEKIQSKLARLKIRIVCRTADWTSIFEDQLKKLWGENSVKAFVLAPLRREDVLEAASLSNIDQERFGTEVSKKNAEAFSANPTLLKFLIDEFHQSSSLPETKRELYKKGCHALCREINDTHAQSYESHPEQRFVIAARIAALTIFGERSGIAWQNVDLIKDTPLNIDQCTEDKEIIGQHDFPVYERYVRETLETALFHGGSIRQWAQKTYAEFLAAWYVVNKLDLPQIKSLVLSNGKLIPQLEQTAMWIASFDRDIFDQILESSPEVLLRSDVAPWDVESRKKLILALFEKCQIDPHFYYNKWHLSVLKHQGFEEIIETYLDDSEQNDNIRELAIDVAVECKATELLDELARIALDPEQSLHLRSTAAGGILTFGDTDSKIQLKSLAILPLDNRNYGDLKRHGIKATWPQELSAEELFRTLFVPSNETSLTDYYTSENWRELILPFLKPVDIPFALQWVARQEIRGHNLPRTFAELMDAILLMAWQHLKQPGIVAAFAATTIALWQRHEGVLDRHGRRMTSRNEGEKLTNEIVQLENDKRFLLLNYLIPLAAPIQQIAFQFLYDVPLLTYADLPWLVEQFNQHENIEEKSLITELIRHIVNLNNPQHFHDIFQVGQENPNLWQALDFQLFMGLGSEQAQQARDRHLQRLEHKRYRQETEQQRNRPPLYPSPAERVRNELEKFEDGDTGAWWRMSRWMMSNLDGTYNRLHEQEFDFFNLPVWNELKDEEKGKIINSAATYIARHDPDSGVCDHWWEKRKWIFWPVVAGCRAFFALVTHNSLIDEISENDWTKWAPVLTYYIYYSLTFSNEEQSRKSKYAFLKLLKLLAPYEVTETIIWIAECEDKEKHFYLASRIEELWDDHLAQAVIHEIQQETFSASNAAQLLSGISTYKFSLAKPLLNDWLISPSSIENDAGEKVVIACQLFLQHAPDAGWSLVWPLIQQDTEFGKQVVRRIVHSERFSSSIAGKLTETSLANFYLWLFQNYPPESDPPRIGFPEVTIEHELADFRDGLLNHLIEKGSVIQLKRIQNNLKYDLGHAINQADIFFRRNSWRSPSPEELRTLFRSNTSRWIQDEGQLLDVLEEMLGQLNRDLQGQNGATPSVIDLWNEYPHGKRANPKFTPKDEERLSDYVERYLKRELEGKNIFVGREPQIRRGNYTDILVEAKPILDGKESGYSLSVVIEVKGCWHPKLKTAMREQLVDQYLRPHQKQHGIYLVGRFFCEKWNQEGDKSRWRPSSKIDDTELRSELGNQAQKLAQEGFDIRVNILDAKLSA